MVSLYKILSLHCSLLNLQRSLENPEAIYCYRELFALRQRSILSWRENPVWSMAPVFHTDDNAPGFIMSSVQSPCLLFCPAPSPPLLHTPWLSSFVSLSVTLLPVSLWGEAVQTLSPRGMLGSVVGSLGLGIGGLVFETLLISASWNLSMVQRWLGFI